MTQAKYIMVKEFKTASFPYVTTLVPVVFPEFISHFDMMLSLGLKVEDIDSAGFVSIQSNGSVRCHGESTGLKLGSKERDSSFVSRMFGWEP